jgi:hypothetical protein
MSETKTVESRQLREPWKWGTSKPPRNVEAESIRTATAEADSYVPLEVTAEVDVDEVTIPAEATNEKNNDA